MVWQGGSSEEEAVTEDERYPGGGGPLPSWPGPKARAGEADEKYQGTRTREEVLPHLRQVDFYFISGHLYLNLYDRLVVDDNVYIFNDLEGRVERLPHKMALSSSSLDISSMTDTYNDSGHNFRPGTQATQATQGAVFRRGASVDCLLDRWGHHVIGMITQLQYIYTL